MKKLLVLWCFAFGLSPVMASKYDIIIMLKDAYTDDYVEGAHVEVKAVNGEEAWSMVTENDGLAAVQGCKLKKFSVSVKLKGCADVQFEVNNPSRTHQYIDIRLHPDQSTVDTWWLEDDLSYGVLALGAYDFQKEDTEGGVGTNPCEGGSPATFKGGEDSLQAWLDENLVYSPVAMLLKQEGEVVIGYCVEQDGSVSHLRVLESPNEFLAQEAICVLRKMPKWTAGTCDGTPVRFLFRQTIDFRIEGIHIGDFFKYKMWKNKD